MKSGLQRFLNHRILLNNNLHRLSQPYLEAREKDKTIAGKLGVERFLKDVKTGAGCVAQVDLEAILLL